MINWSLNFPNIKSEFHYRDLYFLCSLKILPICDTSWCPSNKVGLQAEQTLQNSFYDDFIKQLVYICWTYELSIRVEFNLGLKLKSICHRSNTQIFSFNIMQWLDLSSYRVNICTFNVIKRLHFVLNNIAKKIVWFGYVALINLMMLSSLYNQRCIKVRVLLLIIKILIV